MIIEESHRDFYKIGTKEEMDMDDLSSLVTQISATRHFYPRKTISGSLITQTSAPITISFKMASSSLITQTSAPIKTLFNKLLSLKNTACKNNNFLTQMKEVEGFVTGLFVFGKIKQL